MIKKFSVRLFLLICFLLFPLLFSLINTVKAQEETGLTISPVVFELNGDPGDTLQNQIKIYNPTDSPTSVKMKVEDFSPVGEEGEVTLEEPGSNSTYSIASWTTISPSTFTIGAKEQKIITFTIKVPQNSEPGGHYGSIAATISGASGQVTGSAVSTTRASLILLRISGSIHEEIIVNSFKATKSFQEYGPVDFEVKFENTGNVHLKPAGFITITNIFGKQVAQLDIPQNNVIPGAIRQANTKWDIKNLLGIYTATLVANYGSSSKSTITSVTTFTVFPWKTGLIVVGILLVVFYILRKSRRRLSRAFKALTDK